VTPTPSIDLGCVTTYADDLPVDLQPLAFAVHTATCGIGDGYYVKAADPADRPYHDLTVTYDPGLTDDDVVLQLQAFADAVMARYTFGQSDMAMVHHSYTEGGWILGLRFTPAVS
jgi:hypothetical protein